MPLLAMLSHSNDGFSRRRRAHRPLNPWRRPFSAAPPPAQDERVPKRSQIYDAPGQSAPKPRRARYAYITLIFFIFSAFFGNTPGAKASPSLHSRMTFLIFSDWS
jgi:hypothetical protein